MSTAVRPRTRRQRTPAGPSVVPDLDAILASLSTAADPRVAAWAAALAANGTRTSSDATELRLPRWK